MKLLTFLATAMVFSNMFSQKGQGCDKAFYHIESLLTELMGTLNQNKPDSFICLFNKRILREGLTAKNDSTSGEVLEKMDQNDTLFESIFRQCFYYFKTELKKVTKQDTCSFLRFITLNETTDESFTTQETSVCVRAGNKDVGFRVFIFKRNNKYYFVEPFRAYFTDCK